MSLNIQFWIIHYLRLGQSMFIVDIHLFLCRNVQLSYCMNITISSCSIKLGRSRSFSCNGVLWNSNPCNKTLPPILIPFGENSIGFKLTQVNFLVSLSFNKLQQLPFLALTISQIYYELH